MITFKEVVLYRPFSSHGNASFSKQVSTDLTGKWLVLREEVFKRAMHEFLLFNCSMFMLDGWKVAWIMSLGLEQQSPVA